LLIHRGKLAAERSNANGNPLLWLGTTNRYGYRISLRAYVTMHQGVIPLTNACLYVFP
jgi:hypothetical protein